MKTRLAIVIGILIGLGACQKDLPSFEDDTPYYPDLPFFAPEMPVPDDNKLTTQRVKLGEKLFFDKRLSRDLSISCATCHQPQKAFANNDVKAIGIEDRTGLRNVPSLLNAGYGTLFNWDGGARSLRAQALAPIQSHRELDMTLDKITSRLEDDAGYASLAKEAYGSAFNNQVVIKALEAYERSLTSFNTPFDDYYYRGKNTISEEAKAGLGLFMSDRTNCSSCHTPPLFTNHSFANIGLYETYADSGRARVTFRNSDLGKFKIPALRNVALTAPYMHDGSMQTLEDVVQHFSKGGKAHPNKSADVRPLNLTEKEQNALVAFLKTLTDRSIQEKPE